MLGPGQAEVALTALGQHLQASGAGPLDLVVCGGRAMNVHYLGRFDLICLKLYAYADTQTLRHREDILALAPSSNELEAATRWVLTHDDSEAFLTLLRGALTALGAQDVAAKLG